MLDLQTLDAFANLLGALKGVFLCGFGQDEAL
jgi:hypothetical protein